MRSTVVFFSNLGRFALLINNCSYTNLPELPPKNFTDSLGVELEQCGWQGKSSILLPFFTLKNMKNQSFAANFLSFPMILVINLL